ncbi:MAG: glucosyltransferase domain-containing protein [Roseburia sp.]|nr:glucosyltransferase domain-containing protein [Roseburia sp.]
MVKVLSRRISKEFKAAFIATLVIGMIAHIYMFTNKLPNYDDLRTLDGFGATFKLGRWFLWFVGAIAWHFDFVFSLPWMNGLITLVFVALSAGVMAELLRIKSNTGNVLLGAALIVFPSWTSSFFFMFTAPYYAVAVFMAVLGVYLCVNYKWGGICFIVLMACSMGIYQAYLPFAATLCVVILLMKLFDGEKAVQVIKSAVWYLINIILSVVLYLIITKLSLLITGQELTQTKGINTMGQFDVARISEIVQTIFGNITGVFLGNTLEISYNYATRLMYLLLFLCGVYCIIRLLIRQYKNREYLSCAATLVLLLAFETAINGIWIMCADGVYSLMYYSYVFLMLLPLCMLEHSARWEQSKPARGVEFMTAFGLVIGIVSYCHFANAEYLSMELSYEQAKSYCTTLITQIKSAEGYSDELPVLFVGQDIEDEALYKNDVMDAFLLSGRDVTLVEAYSREWLLRYYCGFDPEYASKEAIDADKIAKLPVYPDAGAIQVIDGVVVIRLE